MKKKLLLLFCFCAFVFLLFGCSSSSSLNSSKFKKTEVLSGSGYVIGERGYIEVSKDVLKSASQDDFKKFVASHVKDSGLNYVSIICDDGTGICFVASMSVFADFGQISADGSIIKSSGTILLNSDGSYSYKENGN